MRRSTSRSRSLLAIVLVAVLTLGVAACGGDDDTTSSSDGGGSSSGVTKAAWVFVGPKNDGGWSQAHNEGRLAVEKALGSKVKTTFKETLKEKGKEINVDIKAQHEDIFNVMHNV